jgi:hypothetical protein
MDYDSAPQLMQRRKHELQPIKNPDNEAKAKASGSTSKHAESFEDNPQQYVKQQIGRLRNELLLLISVPFLFLISFAGNGAVYCLAFGGIACYVLDILESVEVSI